MTHHEVANAAALAILATLQTGLAKYPHDPWQTHPDSVQVSWMTQISPTIGRLAPTRKMQTMHRTPDGLLPRKQR